MKYGLIGEKLGHSFSAQIHQRLFNYTYELQELTLNDFRKFMSVRDFIAVNVTIPYKEKVIPYLDEVDESARRIGAVNTVVNRQGKLYGYNTDADGLTGLIEHSGIVVKDKKVLVLGSGGTSKTAVAVVKALGCSDVLRVSRTARDGCISYEQASTEYSDVQVLINTTPCGMYPHNGDSPINLALYQHLEGVVDVVYNPLCTRLVCDARERGIPAVGGLYMLVFQAARAAEHFTDLTVSQQRIDDIYHQLMQEKQNIVLVGMPGCGKSTVGQRLAALLDRPFIDTDTHISAEMGCTIPELFKRVGESGFRDCESKAISHIASRQGAVIATGGGAVLRPENVQRLKENGRLYFLDRSLNLISATSDRPLSSTISNLQKRHTERYPIYASVCDVRVKADGTPEEVANWIREDFLYENFSD